MTRNAKLAFGAAGRRLGRVMSRRLSSVAFRSGQAGAEPKSRRPAPAGGAPVLRCSSLSRVTGAVTTRDAVTP